MGNTHDRRKLDGISYDIRQKMVHTLKPDSWTKRFLLTIITTYTIVPLLAVVAPIWYILVMNSAIARKIAAEISFFLMPWLDLAFADVKVELLKDVHGRVLDVGSGQGCWLKYLDRATLVTELEPNENHITALDDTVQRFVSRNPKVHVDIVKEYLQEFHPTELYDYIILGNVLCEVCDTEAFVANVDRLLKPGGKIVFQENIREPPGTIVGWIQDILNMYWNFASSGYHCNRDPLKLLKTVRNWHVEAWDLRLDGYSVFFDRMAVGIAMKSKFP